jgi:hypothetical protein
LFFECALYLSGGLAYLCPMEPLHTWNHDIAPVTLCLPQIETAKYKRRERKEAKAKAQVQRKEEALKALEEKRREETMKAQRKKKL